MLEGAEMLVSTVAALAAAALFAFTTNLQREAASSVPPEGSGPLHLLRRLMTNRRWLVGGLIGGVALGLHAVALSSGSVMVVQSVMALGLVIALYVESVRERRRLRRTELGGALLVVAGVVAVVGVGRHTGRSSAVIGPVTAVCVAIVVVALTAVVRSRRTVGSRWGARLLAVAGGACFAVDAVFLQRAADLLRAGLSVEFGPGFDPAVAAVQVAGFFGSSMVGGIAMHRAYQVAPLRSVQPALAATEPVIAFLIGVLVLRDGVVGGLLGYLLLVGGLVAISGGILVGLLPQRVSSRIPHEAGLPNSRRTALSSSGRTALGPTAVAVLPPAVIEAGAFGYRARPTAGPRGRRHQVGGPAVGAATDSMTALSR
jgi:drug/metabolite transporter (DMT)-like permease